MNVAREEGEDSEAGNTQPLGLPLARAVAQRPQPDLQWPQEQLLCLPPVLLHSFMAATVSGSYASKDGNSFNKYLWSTFSAPGTVLGT